MKSYLQIFLLSLSFLFLYSYRMTAQNYNWVKGIIGDAVGNSVAVDSKGNSYVTGYFQGTATLGTFQLTSYGFRDIFIAKYDVNGNCLWAKHAGCSKDDDDGKSISVDTDGNSYVTGYFSGTATFDTIQITAISHYDMFIAKYDVNGNCQWVKQAGGSGADGLGISVDANGISYVSGDFEGSATFDTIHLTSYGVTDIFIAKYDVNGNCLWVKQAGGSRGDDYGTGISIDNKGNSYVTGTFSDTATFGTFQLKNNYDYGDIFIAKYDVNGNCLWAKQAGGSSDDEGISISTDNNGNSYVTGYFQLIASFGTFQLTSKGFWDMFVAKYDDVGNCLWVKSAGGTGGDTGWGISVDAIGNSYITGTFDGTATFDTFQINSYGFRDIFLAKYGVNGNCLWVKHAGSAVDLDEGYSITIDINGNSFVTGYFRGTATFDSIQILNSGAFIAKISNPTETVKDVINRIPRNYSLQQNYPNPFNPNTTISYSIPSASNIKIIVYNTLGQTVKVLENGFKNAGNYSVNFNASDLPSGKYFYKLEAGQFSQVKKMMIVK